MSKLSGHIPFSANFPEDARKDTVGFRVQGNPRIPDDEYGLIEFYCQDPDCDCRRVLLKVMSRGLQREVATVNYSFVKNNDEFDAFLDPLHYQSPFAGALFDLVLAILEDCGHAMRMFRHYLQMKEFSRRAHSLTSAQPNTTPGPRKKKNKPKKSKRR